jgi:hypothetical protein
MRALYPTLMAVLTTTTIVSAQEHDPKTWGVQINLPGTLSAYAQYCTRSGKCDWVIARTPQGDILGCYEKRDSELCLKARIPVQVLAISLITGVTMVRLKGQNFAVGGQPWHQGEPDGSFVGGPVSVIYYGKNIPTLCIFNWIIPSDCSYIGKEFRKVFLNIYDEGGRGFMVKCHT